MIQLFLCLTTYTYASFEGIVLDVRSIINLYKKKDGVKLFLSGCSLFKWTKGIVYSTHYGSSNYVTSLYDHFNRPCHKYGRNSGDQWQYKIFKENRVPNMIC